MVMILSTMYVVANRGDVQAGLCGAVCFYSAVCNINFSEVLFMMYYEVLLQV